MTTRRTAPKPRQRWTKRQILALGTRCTIAEAGSIIAGLSETQSRALYHRGDFPVPVLRVGHRLIVPTEPILRLLHLDDGGADNRLLPPGQRLPAAWARPVHGGPLVGPRHVQAGNSADWGEFL